MSYAKELCAEEASESAAVALDSPESVLRFWFGSLELHELEPLGYIRSMMGVWFAGSSARFNQVQLQSVALVQRVAAAQRGDEPLGNEWRTPTGYLARVLLLDQFPRCIYRGQSLAFQYDDLVAGLVREVVCERKWFSAPGVYVPIQRLFLGVALQHQEDMEAQRLGVEMAGRVAEGACKEVQSWVSNLQGYPMEHHDVMERFGRFPGRNAALGRVSTAEEEEWLRSPECPNWAKSQLLQPTT